MGSQSAKSCELNASCTESLSTWMTLRRKMFKSEMAKSSRQLLTGAAGLAPAPVEDQVAIMTAAVEKAGSNFGTAATATATASYVAEKTRCKLFVGNLHSEIPKERLSQVFGECGRVVNVHVMTGKSKFGSACAFVEMATPSEAELALKALHQKYEPRIGSMTAPVTVTYFQSQSSGKAAQAMGGPTLGGFQGFSNRFAPYPA
ncbi:unnamed protein product [Effrenium voratum]|nr:unnamed protein product [Effrenium voratum]